MRNQRTTRDTASPPMSRTVRRGDAYGHLGNDRSSARHADCVDVRNSGSGSVGLCSDELIGDHPC